MLRVIILMLVVLGFTSCQDDVVSIPKPHAFPKVTFPTKNYTTYKEVGSPYSFEYPAYAKMERNTEFMGKEVPNNYWYDLFFPDFDAKIHLTYYNVKDRKHYDKLISDVYRMANEHTQKANYINEVSIKKEGVYKGKLFDITGPAATPFEFYLTDETKHFIRGSLYLNTRVRPDSLAPIYDFLKKDAIHVINSLEWQK